MSPVQTDLFGRAVKRSIQCVYKQPKNNYEKFVEAYLHRQEHEIAGGKKRKQVGLTSHFLI